MNLIELPEDIKVPAGYSVLKPTPTLCIPPNSNEHYHFTCESGTPVESRTVYRTITIDFEATGLDPKTDTPIEIGLIEALIDVDTGQVFRISKTYSQLNDPGFPIPEEAIQVTGITDTDVKGKRFDLEAIENFITMDGKHAPIMVAHNSEYDRTLFERMFPHLSNLPWACTFKDIVWPEPGPLSKKQELILLQQGYTYNAHRAFEDCLALIWLIHINAKVCLPILHLANEPTFTIYANHFPFDDKDKLKAPDLKFEWGGDSNKVWMKSVKGESNLTEIYERLSELYTECGVSPELISYERIRTPLVTKRFTRKNRN